MAAIGFSANVKTVTVPSGTPYAYVYFAQTDPLKSTILFLHGFPSSSYDWLYQIPYFAARGYDIIAPDLLSYGGTDKPHAVEPYIFKIMAADIVALLEYEGLDKVHTVGYDFGSIFLSAIINYYPSRILSSTFLAVPKSPPGRLFDLDLAHK
jgi:soluble epoxide hydrolase/lipid-phosphate phosphatase